MPFWINILVGLLAFVVAALGGKALLPWLHKLKFGQPLYYKMKKNVCWMS